MSTRILYSSGRIVSIQLIILIGFCALIGRLIYLQIYQDVFLNDQVIFAYLIEQQGLRSFLLRTIDNHLNEVNDLINNIDLYLSE